MIKVPKFSVLVTVIPAILIWSVRMMVLYSVAQYSLITNPSHRMDACENGYLTQRRTQFWKYMDGDSPAIADVLTSGDALYVVINLVVLENYRISEATYEWQTAEWAFTFVNNSIPPIKATSFGVMEAPNNLILYAVLPPSLLKANPNQVLHVDIKAVLPKRTHIYHNVPFCLSPTPESFNPKYFVAACIKCVPTEPWIDSISE